MNMNVLKNKFTEYYCESCSNKKYLALYFVFILVIFSSMMNIGNYIHPKMEIFIFVFMVLFGFFIIDYHTLHNTELYKTAFIFILCTGIILAIFTPVAVIPDEHEHFARSVITATGNMFPQFDLKHTGFNTIGLVNQIAGSEGNTIFNAGISSGNIDYSHIFYRSAFQHIPFYAYLAPSLGVLLGELIGLSAIGTLILARSFNVLLYSIFIAIAIKKTPILKVPMFVVSCTPLVMFITGSVSADVLVNGLAFVVIAYFFYMLKGNMEISRRELITFFILVCLLGFCKPTFFAFFLLIFFIPRKKFKKNYYIYTMVSFILLVVIIVLYSKFFVNPNFVHSFRLDYYVNNNINPTLQANYLLKHIPETLIVILHIPNYLSQLFLSLFDFSFLQYKYGSSFINAIYPIFLGALFCLYPYKEKISNKIRFGVLLVVIVIFYGTYITFLLSWTPVGQINEILGVQSRYFLPLFALLPFCLNFNTNIIESEKIDNIFIVLAIGFTAALLFITIITWC